MSAELAPWERIADEFLAGGPPTEEFDALGAPTAELDPPTEEQVTFPA